jgi:hypothetical protein
MNTGILKLKALIPKFMYRDRGIINNMSLRQRHGSKSSTAFYGGNGWSLLYSSHFTSKESAPGSHSLHI